MNIVVSILVVIVVLGVIATVHELAHFFVARLLKIKAFVVSIFVGPKLISWKREPKLSSVGLTTKNLGGYIQSSSRGFRDCITTYTMGRNMNAPRITSIKVILASPPALRASTTL